MGNPEEVKSFEKQIEAGLDQQIQELSKLDEQKSQTLQGLKLSIVQQLMKERIDSPETAEKEEKFTEDLRLTQEELKVVFDEVIQDHSKLFSDNSIESFTDFKYLLGLENKSNVIYAPSLKEVMLWGQKIDFVVPFGSSEQICRNYEQAFKQIETREDLKAFITPETKFTPHGGLRVEFTIIKDGKEVKYCADPDHVLRVNKDVDPEKRKALLQLTLKRKHLEMDLEDSIRQDKTLHDDIRNAIHLVITNKVWDVLMDFETEIPEKYKIMLEQLKEYTNQEKEMLPECSNRFLFDEQIQQPVREECQPFYYSNFKYVYQDKLGLDVTSVEYEINFRHMYKMAAFGIDKTIVKYGTRDKKQVMESLSIPSTFDESEMKMDTSMQFREDGTLLLKKYYSAFDYNVDLYDDTGTKVLFRLKNAILNPKIVMYDSNNNEFATKIPELSDSEYLDYLANNLTTFEQLTVFFEQFMQYVDDSNDSNNPLTQGSQSKSGEYWQMAEETVRRIEDGKMLGDCDDYAFLAKEIFRRQGKTTYVQGIPDHAVCIWFEKRADGRWNAYSFCTYGLDKNGNRFDMPIDSEKEKGYATLDEALNSLLSKYDESGQGLENGADKYRITNGYIELLDIPEKGIRTNALVPVEFLLQKTLLDRVMKARNMIKLNKYLAGLSCYEELIQDDPSHRDYYYWQIACTLCLFSKNSDKSTEFNQVLQGYKAKHPDLPELSELSDEPPNLKPKT